MNEMMTELTLRIHDDDQEQVACTTILFGEEPLKPIPMIGDSITLSDSKTIYRGIVFARAFDYSLVDEHDETAPLRILIEARLSVVAKSNGTTSTITYTDPNAQARVNAQAARSLI
jgi:hypothetical protein